MPATEGGVWFGSSAPIHYFKKLGYTFTYKGVTYPATAGINNVLYVDGSVRGVAVRVDEYVAAKHGGVDGCVTPWQGTAIYPLAAP